MNEAGHIVLRSDRAYLKDTVCIVIVKEVDLLANSFPASQSPLG